MTRHMELLDGLADRDAAEVTALASRVRLAAAATLFRLGDEASCPYVLTSVALP